MIPNPYPGSFIVFDGIDGCGKTEQIKRTAAWLRSTLGKESHNFHTILTTKEPNKNGLFGKQIYEELRNEGIGLKDTDLYRFQMWYACDSKTHLRETVIPSLKTGSLVLSDRFRSSMVYGIEHLSTWREQLAHLMQMNQMIIGEDFIWPDATIILDVDVYLALSRIAKKGVKFDGHEKKQILERVRQSYVFFSKTYPNCYLVDASGSADKVFEKVQQVIRGLAKLAKHFPA